MKPFVALLGIGLAFVACKNESVVPEKLIGVWNHTSQVQYKHGDNTWGPWSTIYAAIPPIEFASNGRFLRDGKEGAECCSAGNRFTVVNEKIIFSDLKSCPYASCLPCTEWEIPRLDSDTLVVESCMTRVKYSRAK